jgi:hypothetical protein
LSTRSEIQFSDDRSEAVRAIESVASGRGWCNLVPGVAGEAPDVAMNSFGLWLNKGVTVATFVTYAPRQDVTQPSTIGVLHTRGRLGAEKISAMLGDNHFKVSQDHNQRGLLLEVPVDTPAAHVLDVMCALTRALCDYGQTGRWRLDLFLR